MAGSSNFLNNGSLDTFLQGMGTALVNTTNAIGTNAPGIVNTLLGGSPPKSGTATKTYDMTPRSGLKKFFTFYNMDANGVIMLDASGNPSINMTKAIGIPAGSGLLLYGFWYKFLRRKKVFKKKGKVF